MNRTGGWGGGRALVPAFYCVALFLGLPFFFCLKMPKSNRTVENESPPINHASPQSMLGTQQIALDSSVSFIFQCLVARLSHGRQPGLGGI